MENVLYVIQGKMKVWEPYTLLQKTYVRCKNQYEYLIEEEISRKC